MIPRFASQKPEDTYEAGDNDVVLVTTAIPKDLLGHLETLAVETFGNASYTSIALVTQALLRHAVFELGLDSCYSEVVKIAR